MIFGDQVSPGILGLLKAIKQTLASIALVKVDTMYMYMYMYVHDIITDSVKSLHLHIGFKGELARTVNSLKKIQLWSLINSNQRSGDFKR